MQVCGHARLGAVCGRAAGCGGRAEVPGDRRGHGQFRRDRRRGQARGTFEGAFEFLRFAERNGRLVAVSLLNGVVRDEAGEVVGRVVDEVVRLPVAVRQATSEILTLTLGPLDLNLLGLRVQLNRLHLRVTAEAGPGNLLGNLLCDVALLDGPTGLARLLNRIVALLP